MCFWDSLTCWPWPETSRSGSQSVFPFLILLFFVKITTYNRGVVTCSRTNKKKLYIYNFIYITRNWRVITEIRGNRSCPTSLHQTRTSTSWVISDPFSFLSITVLFGIEGICSQVLYLQSCFVRFRLLWWDVCCVYTFCCPSRIVTKEFEVYTTLCSELEICFSDNRWKSSSQIRGSNGSGIRGRNQDLGKRIDEDTTIKWGSDPLY